MTLRQLPSVERRAQWTQDGDEWTQMADCDGQPYAAWKRSLIKAFILPQLTSQTRVLEIAPGRGRWSATLVERAGHVTLVDLSDACVAACRARFAGAAHVTYFVNDGRSLPVGDESQDFVLSIDSFLHMPEEVIAAYLSEISRVLVPGGQASCTMLSGVMRRCTWAGSCGSMLAAGTPS